jgi:hypothetical protein
MAAAQTPQPQICPSPQHQPPLITAGMGLFHRQNIAYLNIHAHFPLIVSQYCFAACSSLLGPYS